VGTAVTLSSPCALRAGFRTKLFSTHPAHFASSLYRRKRGRRRGPEASEPALPHPGPLAAPARDHVRPPPVNLPADRARRARPSKKDHRATGKSGAGEAVAAASPSTGATYPGPSAAHAASLCRIPCVSVLKVRPLCMLCLQCVLKGSLLMAFDILVVPGLATAVWLPFLIRQAFCLPCSVRSRW
jgi:hypothetical protein